jgi:hypothetical protein
MKGIIAIPLSDRFCVSAGVAGGNSRRDSPGCEVSGIRTGADLGSLLGMSLLGMSFRRLA